MTQLPPMPKLEDFPMAYDSAGYNTVLYRLALDVWERVCTKVARCENSHIEELSNEPASTVRLV